MACPAVSSSTRQPRFAAASERKAERRRGRSHPPRASRLETRSAAGRASGPNSHAVGCRRAAPLPCRRSPLSVETAASQATDQETEASVAPPAAPREFSLGEESFDQAAGWSDDVAEMFPRSHLEKLSPAVLLYFPLGCLIAGFRMALWIILLSTDTTLTDNDASIALLRKLLGIFVTWEGADNLPEGPHVLVSNHLTAGDLIFLYTRPNKYVHLITPALPEAVTKVKNHRIIFRHATPATYDQLASEMEAGTIQHPIHLFPEGGMTNGRRMLRFTRGFIRFSRDVPVVPMALRADVPLGINTHTLTSSFLANLFWFSFAPWVSFRCTVMDPMELEEDESPGRFAARVQEAIADELEVPISDLTIQAKKQIVKAAKLRGR